MFRLEKGCGHAIRPDVRYGVPVVPAGLSRHPSLSSQTVGPFTSVPASPRGGPVEKGNSQSWVCLRHVISGPL